MHAAPDTRFDAPPLPGSARVVFVQGRYDGFSLTDHASIVDENAQLLGESWPDTRFAVDLPPGHHEFFGWQSDWPGFIPFAHSCTCLVTRCQEIAVMRARLDAGRTYYVFLRGVGGGGRGPVSSNLLGERYPGTGWSGRFDFLRVSPRVETWSPSLVQSLRPIEPVPAQTAARTQAAGGGYRNVILCMGQRRMNDPEAWNPDESVLRPDDGSVQILKGVPPSVRVP